MPLKPIVKKRLSEDAINQIRDLILGEGMLPGDKLPTERELGKALKVSRPSIREALRMLEIMGFVYVKPGRGIYVKEVDGDLFNPLSNWLTSHKDTLKNHFEARLMLEPTVAGVAALRAKDADFEKLQIAINKFEENRREKDLVAMIRADIEFHSLIVESTGNRVIQLLFETLARFSFDGWKAALRIKSRSKRAAQEHISILEALRRRDKDAAHIRMEQHIRESIKQLRERGL